MRLWKIYAFLVQPRSYCLVCLKILLNAFREYEIQWYLFTNFLINVSPSTCCSKIPESIWNNFSVSSF